jgi:hypothetical protein
MLNPTSIVTQAAGTAQLAITVMKTLVIHPGKDKNTAFLSKVYENLPNCKVMSSAMGTWQVDLEIMAADKIVVLSHGTSGGAISNRQYGSSFYVIDDTSAALMKDKEVVLVFCYASDYAKRNNLTNCFATGMWISELRESKYLGVAGTEEEIEASNEYITSILSAVVEKSPTELYHTVKDLYGEFAEYSKVGKYNLDRIYLSYP